MPKELDEFRQEAADDRSNASNALSTQTRTIALGVLAVVWLLVGGTQQVLADKFSCYGTPLLWIAFVCVVALFLDFMQYVFTLIETDIAVKAAWKATKAAEAGYDEGNIFRRLSTSCFVAKLLATGLAALWVLTIMLSALSASTKPAGTQPAPPVASVQEKGKTGP